MESSGTLYITMFGTFSMTRHGNGQTFTVSDQSKSSKKLWTLIQYLLVFRDRPIPQQEILDLLWSESDGVSPVNTLKTLLHRARYTVASLGFSSGKQTILYRRGAYQWNPEIDIFIDYEQFERHAVAAHLPGEDRLQHLLAAAALYAGPLLPKLATEAWVFPLHEERSKQFLAICSEASELLMERGQYAKVIDLCRHATDIAPHEERLHLQLMRAMVGAGAQQSAIQHYTLVTNLLMDRLGVSPSEEMTALYRQIVKSTMQVELDLHVVQARLSEPGTDNGSYYCEYAIFQDLYRLGVRTAERSGQSAHLAMLSILDASGRPLTARQIAAAMERVEVVIRAGLRRGDAFTRYSASQYLLLLPCASCVNCEIIFQRLNTSFRASYPKHNLVLQCSILPVQP